MSNTASYISCSVQNIQPRYCLVQFCAVPPFGRVLNRAGPLFLPPAPHFVSSRTPIFVDLHRASAKRQMASAILDYKKPLKAGSGSRNSHIHLYTP
ncbi:hypothetical protein [Sporisorium scitamineum]|uniref:Uncharacterized protein n=1 Tax=Sporisorium scitamineum TaxID=49012 RepID=A0A0F7RXI2_9BASI|nr:hypothetical protein [Sporisorium scitamineum]